MSCLDEFEALLRMSNCIYFREKTERSWRTAQYRNEWLSSWIVCFEPHPLSFTNRWHQTLFLKVAAGRRQPSRSLIDPTMDVRAAPAEYLRHKRKMDQWNSAIQWSMSCRQKHRRGHYAACSLSLSRALLKRCVYSHKEYLATNKPNPHAASLRCQHWHLQTHSVFCFTRLQPRIVKDRQPSRHACRCGCLARVTCGRENSLTNLWPKLPRVITPEVLNFLKGRGKCAQSLRIDWRREEN